MKVSSIEKLEAKNITLFIKYTIENYTWTRVSISKINIRSTNKVITKVKYNLYTEIEMRLSDLF